MFPRRFLSASFSILSVAALQAETVLVSETFSDGSRSGNNPPNSLEWYCSVSGRFLQDGKGFMSILGATDTARHAVAQFVSPEKPITLEKGQSLTLSFVVKPLTIGIPAGNSIRFGLFNTANDAINIFTADGQNPMDASAQGYVGAVMTKSETSVSLSIMKREGLGGFLTNSHAYQSVKTGPASFFFEAGKSYEVKLRVERKNETTAEIRIEIAGQGQGDTFELSYQDTSAPFFTFDTIGFSIFKSVVDAEFSDIWLTRHPQ